MSGDGFIVPYTDNKWSTAQCVQDEESIEILNQADIHFEKPETSYISCDLKCIFSQVDKPKSKNFVLEKREGIKPAKPRRKRTVPIGPMAQHELNELLCYILGFVTDGPVDYQITLAIQNSNCQNPTGIPNMCKRTIQKALDANEALMMSRSYEWKRESNTRGDFVLSLISRRLIEEYLADLLEKRDKMTLDITDDSDMLYRALLYMRVTVEGHKCINESYIRERCAGEMDKSPGCDDNCIKHMRRKCAEEMRQKRDKYMDLTGIATEDGYISYCDSVENSGKWGNEAELEALSNVFKVSINLYSLDEYENKKNLFVTEIRPDGLCTAAGELAYIGFYSRSSGHYKPVIPIGNNPE